MRLSCGGIRSQLIDHERPAVVRAPHYASRIAGNDASRFNVTRHDRPGADDRSVSNMNTLEHGRSSPDPHIIADHHRLDCIRRRAFVPAATLRIHRMPIVIANRDAGGKKASLSDLDRATREESAVMANERSIPNHDPGGAVPASTKLNARFP